MRDIVSEDGKLGYNLLTGMACTLGRVLDSSDTVRLSPFMKCFRVQFDIVLHTFISSLTSSTRV